MARLPRIDLPDVPQHLYARGNNRSRLFFDDADRYVFRHAVEWSLAQYGCRLHAFVLMSNHFHLLATGLEHGAVSRLMQSIGRRYVRFVNARRSRTGTLFEGRFHSSLVDSDTYFFTVMRYIELNPVRAGMVGHPAQYHWSSHGANRSGEPSWPITPHALYLALAPDPDARGRAYGGLFDAEMSQEELERVRASLRQSRVLGSPEFQGRITAALDRPCGPTSHGGLRYGAGRIKGTDHQVF